MNTEIQNLFLDITRVDKTKHEIECYGLRGDLQDSCGTFIDLDSAIACMEAYMLYPAVRQMHATDIGVGKTINWEVDDKGIKITAKIVDKDVWEKIEEGVYTGVSVGGKQAFTVRNGKNVGKLNPKDWQKGDVIHLEAITEYSVCDSPSNKGCGPLIYRLDDSKELNDMKKEIKVEEVKIEDVERQEEVAPRPDVNPKEGEKKYGSVKFADTKNKKYPIDTEKHIRAAYSYINMPKNAGKYSSEDVAAIKAKIVAAWKSKIDKEGPPSADVKKADSVDVERCACDPYCSPYVSDEIDDCMNAIYALQQIKGLLSKEEGETDPEDSEDGKQIEALELAMQAIKDFIASEIQEDNSVEKVAVVDVERVGAAISADNKTKAQAIHDHAVGLGAICECSRCNSVDTPQDNGHPSNKETNDVTNADVVEVIPEVSDVTRAAKTLFEEEITDVDALVERVAAEFATLNEKIKVLEAIPAAPSVSDIVTRVITKDGEVVGEKNDVKRIEDSEDYKKSTPQAQALMLAKEARRNQGPQQNRNFPR